MKIEFFSLFLLAFTGIARGANILGMFLTYSQSHVIVHMAVVRALIDRGHNVTVITSMPLNDPNPGYRHIFLKEAQFTQADIDLMVNKVKDAPAHMMLVNLFFFIKNLVEKYANFVSDPNFVSFIEEGNQFDLMLLGYTFNEFQLGVAAHFKCPTVLSFMIQPVGHLSRIIGNPTFPAFVPAAPFMDSSPMGFYGRVLSFIINVTERTLSGGFSFFIESLYNKNYPPDKYPSLEEMKRNVSLELINHHFSEGPVRPLVPGLVEIGGIQIKDQPDPLPKDIEIFLENSSQGAIYFSLGSYARGEHLGSNAVNTIYNVFSSLPYHIIWKCDDENRPGNASNIIFKKWLPQDDILAHRNLKLFVTHAGKGSITESEYHGVPMVALPIIGDQHGNAQTMQTKGHGVMLGYNTMTEESFRQAVLDVLENKKYRSAVQRFSKLYRDRPLTARQSALYWIEYVIRHRGARHMQSPLKELNIFQENSVDVILFLVGVIYVALKVGKVLIRVLVLSIKKLWKIVTRKSKLE